jgi:hypothetical protein
MLTCAEWEPMSNVTLRASDLYSKIGFGDGDMILWTEGIDLRGVDCQRVLVRLVREHLLPSLPEPIEVDDSPAYEMHNPIRAADWGTSTSPVRLICLPTRWQSHWPRSSR